MLNTRPLRDALTGTRDQLAGFEHLDMTHRLRMRAFVDLCMPVVFDALYAELGLLSLRNRGYAPVSFYLDFAAGEAPIASGSVLALTHTIRLCRSIADAGGRRSEGEAGRLMFVSQVGISGEAHNAATAARAAGGVRPALAVGSARIMHVLTRPAAAPGAHRVDTIPEELHGLKEHRWKGPLPSLENLSQVPEGHAPAETGSWAERLDVWGIPNTDVNQHVNVKEYVMGAENHFSRLLHGAGLGVAPHRIAGARLLLRKPFFPGQSYAIRAQLSRLGARTRMHAGFHLLEGDQAAARASSFVVLEGVLEVPRR